MRNFVLPALLSLLVIVLPHIAAAQTLAGCTATDLTDPPRIAYQCPGGLVIEAEAAAALGIVTAAPDGRPTDVEVSSDAVLIEVEPGSGPFQIRTPHAIAAVRGTEYAVDVEGGKTAIFVAEGEVAVSRTDGGDTVVLGPGFGVDVTPGEPLVVREWGAQRVTNLLNRFGR